MSPRFVWLAGGAACLAVVALLAAFLADRALDGPGPLDGDVTLVIVPGSGVTGIATTLEAHGVIRSALLFRLVARVKGKARSLQAGEYAFTTSPSLRQVMETLARGDRLVRRLTIPEGLTSEQVLHRVLQAPGLKGPVPPVPAEGSLLPETYHYSYGDERAAMLARMEAAMNRAVAALWSERDPDLPLATPQEAVILASIIERETGQADERALIAGVFANRLRIGMPLQSDPTVAYGVALEEGLPGRVLDRPLSRADLARPGPFNSYRQRGLPPGPITNPGPAALRAAMNPAETESLYFVADGTGGHAFARTLQEHNRNVRRWRALRDAAAQADDPETATPAPLEEGGR